MGMAERIRERRLAMGYTQEELAAKLGLQKSAIAKYENGRVENIKRSIISKMAEVLECSPAYLMDWADAPATKLKPGINFVHTDGTTQTFDIGSLVHSIMESVSEMPPEQLELVNNMVGGKKRNIIRIENPHNKDKQDAISTLNAAHVRTDVEVTDKDMQNDEDIMNGDDF